MELGMIDPHNLDSDGSNTKLRDLVKISLSLVQLDSYLSGEWHKQGTSLRMS